MTNFTLSHYADTINEYLDNEYKFTLMDRHLSKNEKQIILSHDVDMDPTLVSKMSKVEDFLGVKSTYFFRTRSRKYNFFSHENICLMHDLVNRGHDIGIHYEPPFPQSELKESVILDIEKLFVFAKESTGLEITFFNVHEPARTGLDISAVLPEKNRCYNSSFFKNFKYLSDSSARWREGCFCEHVEKWNKLLVLTHPLWWYAKTPGENY